MIDALAELQAIGRGDRGTTRLPWTAELAAAEDWFRAQAETAGLRVERDPAGSLWACPATDPPWWGAGSHLDSVREGGAWDGALGVAAAFEVARRCERPVAVIAFADEEGARFNTPTFGSRALIGRLDPSVLDRLDAGGVRLADALAGFGVEPSGVTSARAWLARLSGFVELHIDQSREVARLGVPAASVSGLAARRRVRVAVRGRADHAGTTPMDEREDALAAAACRIAAVTQPRTDLRATVTRMVVEPNALSTIPSEVTFWADLRSPHPLVIEAAMGELGEAAVVESTSPPVEFDAAVREALAPAPEMLCWAGHDAGILAERIPAGMLLVRNESGISHSPDEHVEIDDAVAATEALVAAVERMA